MDDQAAVPGDSEMYERLQPYLSEFIERAKAGGEKAFFYRLTAEWIWNMPDDLPARHVEAVMDFLARFTADEDEGRKPARQPEKMRRAGV